MPHYRVRFRNYANQNIYVYIYDMTLAIPANPSFTELVPAENPLVIQEDADTDRMVPVRKQSGHLQLLQSSDAILDLTSSLRWRIKAVNASTAWEWRGWICADNSEQDFHLNADTVVYNIMDDIGAMEFCNVNRSFGYDGTFSLLNYLKQAMQNVYDADAAGTHPLGGLRYLYVSKALARRTSADLLSGFDVEASMQNWESETIQTNGQAKIDTTSNFQMLVDWMRILGCTLRTDGRDWFLETVADRNENWEPEQPASEDIGALRMEWSVVMAAASSADITYSGPYYYTSTAATSLEGAGTHQTQAMAGRNVIKVTAGGNSIDSDLLQLSADALKAVGFSDIPAYNSSNTAYPWKATWYKGTDRIQFYRYTISNNAYTPVSGEVGPSNVNGNILWCPGAVYLTQDYYNTGESNDPGSGTSTSGKRNYSFTDMLYIVQRVTYNTGNMNEFNSEHNTYTADRQRSAWEWGIQRALARFDLSKPLLKIRTSTAYSVTGGGLCLKFKVHAVGRDPYGPYNNKQMSAIQYPAPTGGGSQSLVCMLKFGPYYYVSDIVVVGSSGTGPTVTKTERWSTEPGLLVVDADPLSVSAGGWTEFKSESNTKKLTQLYTCDGFSIPIEQYMTGSIELTVLGVSKSMNNNAAFICTPDYDEWGLIQGYDVSVPPPTPLLMIKDMSLTYHKALSESLIELPASATVQNTVNGGSGDYTIDSTLCSIDNKSANIGTLFAAGSPISTLYYSGVTTVPERRLLALATRTAGRTQNFFSLCVRREYPRSLECITYGGHTWRQVAVSDFDVCSGIMTVLYVRI